MKICPTCKTDKPDTEFYRCSASGTGLSGYCKECSKAYTKSKSLEPKIAVDSKSCAKCSRHLSASEFHSNKYSKDGIGTWCKSCWVVLDKARIITPEVIESNRAKYRRHYKNHRDRRIALTQTPNGKFGAYQNDARHRGLELSITKGEFMLFWQKPCHYCDSPIETVGLDRVDNSKGYVLGNVVSCCKFCNFAKRNLSRDAFIQHCEKVAAKAASRKMKFTEEPGCLL